MEHSLDHSKFQRKAIQVNEAQNRIASYIHPIDIESVDLQASHGRTLAQTITAPHPYPSFRRSSMDGYAICSTDTIQCSSEAEITIWLEVIDDIPCGLVSSKTIIPGTTARIMTGAQVPEGADAVVMFEMVELREENGIKLAGLRRHIEQGKNITPIGLELQAEEEVLKQGVTIAAGEISVLATFGIHSVQVYRRPRVAIFSTGSELLKIDEPLQSGKIRNSNTYMIASQVLEAGGEPVILDAIMDDLSLAQRKVEEALAQYDMVVTSGGVSVGDYDIMGDLVRSDRVTMLYNKVTMRPGSVSTAAVKDNKCLFALSGNPGACFVGFELFVRPSIRMMMLDPNPYLPEWTATLGADYDKVNNFTRFVRAKIQIKEGVVYATPTGVDESGVMITIKDSDCLIIVPPSQEGLQAGVKVKIMVLKNFIHPF
ncbi:molybdenum cofactor biosynthesis protein MoeA [Paenibacillus sp. IHBB 10380]|uniref:molybdopterin molybdotransferase MoeA n=1 Tax=Paenibacillus sp. IHBB 10380 TaxID=1566358 RepID=UPI0005CFB07F|nr:gephyrin-like molybdotransferase Glp [Paenibacillus sp. IHBB 10380]AJS58395.1 molybdenum cofactor biosynthesis protein MoeA [Paenibacillus sp. IHBB 10380]